jgi:hypothetical protein
MKLRRKSKVVLVACDGIPDQNLDELRKQDEEETMAASKGGSDVAVALQREAQLRDTIRSPQSRYEGKAHGSIEKTEEGWVPAVVEAKAAAELGVGDEAAPALADEGDSREGGGLRR